jgi:hypothetical protein
MLAPRGAGRFGNVCFRPIADISVTRQNRSVRGIWEGVTLLALFLSGALLLPHSAPRAVTPKVVGDPRWLVLVPKLDPGTDAGSAEFLRIAVAEALPKNAAGVLRFASRLSWFRDACGYPMIEPTNREMRAYFRATIPALKAVHDPSLTRAKRICLTELIKAQRTL